jgi:hypothetical protein
VNSTVRVASLVNVIPRHFPKSELLKFFLKEDEGQLIKKRHRYVHAARSCLVSFFKKNGLRLPQKKLKQLGIRVIPTSPLLKHLN